MRPHLACHPLTDLWLFRFAPRSIFEFVSKGDAASLRALLAEGSSADVSRKGQAVRPSTTAGCLLWSCAPNLLLPAARSIRSLPACV